MDKWYQSIDIDRMVSIGWYSIGGIDGSSWWTVYLHKDGSYWYFCIACVDGWMICVLMIVIMISQCSTKRYVGYEIRMISVKQIRPLRDYDLSVFDIMTWCVDPLQCHRKLRVDKYHQNVKEDYMIVYQNKNEKLSKQFIL